MYHDFYMTLNAILCTKTKIKYTFDLLCQEKSQSSISYLSCKYLTVNSDFLFVGYFVQLKNAFDNLFEGLMESKDGEKEAAKVQIWSVCILCIHLLTKKFHLLH